MQRLVQSMLVYCDKKTQKPSPSRLTCIKGSHSSSYRCTCSCSENICTYVIWHKKAHEIILLYPRVVGSYENQLYNRMKTEGRTKYLKCSTLGCDGSAKIVGDMFFLGVCIQFVLFIYLIPRGMSWTFVYKLKLVTPILIERNIARKKMDMLFSNHR